jgi:uncharacterized RDD family membrane protein YckC
MGSDYYILEDGEQTGPFTFNELTDRGLEVHTRVLSSVTNEWQDACDLPEFYTYFESQGIYLPTGDNLASFGWRLLAFVIDYVIYSILMQYALVILASLGVAFNLRSMDDLFKMPITQMLELQLIYSLIIIVYNSICEASAMKGSIGKRIFKLVVVDIDGQRLSYLNAFLRSAGKALSIFFIYTGFISIFFSEHRQAMHDYLAKTYVVKRN